MVSAWRPSSFRMKPFRWFCAAALLTTTCVAACGGSRAPGRADPRVVAIGTVGAKRGHEVLDRCRPDDPARPLDGETAFDSKIAFVCVKGGTAETRAAVESVLQLHPGDVLTPAGLRRDLESAYATGRLTHVEASARVAGFAAGIRVEIDVTERPSDGVKKVAATASEGVARPFILDGIVALVGDRPIFWSELRYRVRPRFVRIALLTVPAERPAAQAEALRELLTRIIDERLEEQEADKWHVTVTSAEVDLAIERIAQGLHLATADLLVEAKRQEMSEQDYRDEIRRQLLEGKLLNLLRVHVRVTDQDARAVYAVWVKELTGPKIPVDLRTIVVRIRDRTPEAKKAAETVAQQIARRAKGGADFCALAKQYSQDPTTASTCGSHGPMPASGVLPELAALKPGETSTPILWPDSSGDRVFLVVQRAPAAPIPTYDTVREQMMERALTVAFEPHRKQWFVELRASVHIDVRL